MKTLPIKETGYFFLFFSFLEVRAKIVDAIGWFQTKLKNNEASVKLHLWVKNNNKKIIDDLGWYLKKYTEKRVLLYQQNHLLK